MLYNGEMVYCTEQSTSGWCATSAYENTQTYYSYKYCTEDDWTSTGDQDSEDSSSASASASAYTSQPTVTGEYCVPMTYGGVSDVVCTDGDYGWCATSSDSAGNYQTWAYCGYGNSNEDNCYFPFTYNGVDMTTCTDPVSGWCATSVYAVTGTYYSYKYCDADELALGITTVDSGTGTTITGEECVPMIYSGVEYSKCTVDSYGKHPPSHLSFSLMSCL